MPVVQWQPDSIVKCKIKGTGCIILGSDGKQFRCYTNQRNVWTPAKSPCGGGFGSEKITLEYLYNEYLFRNNIWTKSNTLKDLCRYLGCKIIFYRHPKIDFIINYSRQPPFDINKWSYAMCHPQALLLSPHKKLLLSKQTKPTGKLKLVLKIRPPKQMLSKWFFQEQFATAGLVHLQAAAASFQYTRLGCCNQNQILTLYYINPDFYQNSDWAQYREATHPYLPYTNIPSLNFIYPQSASATGSVTIDPHAHSFIYSDSISYEKGYFQSKVLNAIKVQKGTQDLGHLPLGVLRYNLNEDSGKGNKIWLGKYT